MNSRHPFVVLDQSTRGFSVPLRSFETYDAAKAFVLGAVKNSWLCIYPMRQAIAEGLVKLPRFIEILALAEAKAIDCRDWSRRTRIYRIRRKLGHCNS